MKTYSVRIFPTSEQVQQLYQLSDIRMDIWNTLIDIQHTEYATNKRIFNKFELNNMLPGLKNTIRPEWKLLNSKATQTVATEVFSSYRTFFALIKKDPTARPPHNVSCKFHTLSFNQSGWSFKKNMLFINKIPFRFKGKDKFDECNIKEIKIKLRNNKWLVDLNIDDTPTYPLIREVETKVIAIDLGIDKLGVGVDNTGETLVIKNNVRRISNYFDKHINKVKSKQSATTKGSNQFKYLQKVKTKLYNKKNTQVKQALHIQSKKLVDMNYNTIVVGDLTVKRLMKNEQDVFPKMGKSFGNSSVSTFVNFLQYKCQAKGINLVKVDERYTTQTNCLTGKLFPERVELKDRAVELHSGLVIDRDLNSAINIMKRFYNNHLASMNEPLDVSSVVNKSNLLIESSSHAGWKPIRI